MSNGSALVPKLWLWTAPAAHSALHAPQVRAVITAGTKASALAITAASASPEASPGAGTTAAPPPPDAATTLDRVTARPPRMMPASASTGAPNENNAPTPGTGVNSTPRPIHRNEAIASKSAPQAIGGIVGPGGRGVKGIETPCSARPSVPKGLSYAPPPMSKPRRPAAKKHPRGDAAQRPRKGPAARPAKQADKKPGKLREPRQPAPPMALPPPRKRERPAQASPPRSGRCAILGRPNVGKSTLLNAMVGQKLAIATSKPQTTRTTLLGVAMRREPPLQIAFIDTPGLHRPASALGRALVEAAEGELEHCDVALLLVSLGKGAELSDVIGESERELFAKLKNIAEKHTAPPVVLALNKVDQLKSKHLMLPLLEKLGKLYPFAAIVPISALRGVNVEELILEIGSRLPEGFAYDEELLTDKAEKFFAAELVREALIRNTRQEIPYAAAVVIDSFEDDVNAGAPAGRAKNMARITATVVVEKDAHKGIVIGKGGQMLKLIGTEARLEMEQMFGRKVFLELWVKVMEDWTDNPRSVREILEADSAAVAPAAARGAMAQIDTER